MPFDPSSREAQAQAEIAATRQRPGVATSLVAGALALLVGGLALELAAASGGRSAIFGRFAAPAAEDGPLDVARARIAEIETRFDERSALVRALRPRAQALLTRFARYGNERAVVGRDGWLFLRDDLEHLTSRRPAPSFGGDPAATIVEFHKTLAARGVALLVVPTPLKPTVHPERLAADAVAPLRRAGEAGHFAELASRGVAVLDLADRLARDAKLAPLYLATDTHWRPEAMEVAAREIAVRLRELAHLAPGDPALREAAPERRHGRGDVASMLELPPASPLVPLEEVTVLAPAAGATAVRDGAEVLLLGDSFAGIYGAPDLGWGDGAGLADRLAAQLGLPVDRIVRNAGGASATRRALADALARDPDRFTALRVVVWQFAARELSQGAWREVALPQ